MKKRASAGEGRRYCWRHFRCNGYRRSLSTRAASDDGNCTESKGMNATRSGMAGGEEDDVPGGRGWGMMLRESAQETVALLNRCVGAVGIDSSTVRAACWLMRCQHLGIWPWFDLDLRTCHRCHQLSGPLALCK